MIYKTVDKAICFVNAIKKNEPSQQDIEGCVALDANTDHLNITYAPDVVKDPCDICAVEAEMKLKQEIDENGEEEPSYVPGMGTRGSRKEAMDKWAERHHKHPQDGIINAARMMFEILERETLLRQKKIEQDIFDDANKEVAQCNTAKRDTWAAVSIEPKNEEMKVARTTHFDCRDNEIGRLTTMQDSCTAFRQERADCTWPYFFSSEKDNTSLVDTIAKAKTCHSAIQGVSELSQQCDDDQDEFALDYCTYYEAKNTTCNEHDRCWKLETEQRDEIRAFVEKREHSLKLQFRMVKANLCFIEKFQGAENATEAWEMNDAAMCDCARRTYNDTHLNIIYHEHEEKQACDRADVIDYPGQEGDDWEIREFGATPFTDKYNSMKAIDACTPNETTIGTIQGAFWHRENNSVVHYRKDFVFNGEDDWWPSWRTDAETDHLQLGDYKGLHDQGIQTFHADRTWVYPD
jgi:hypothetical protein